MSQRASEEGFTIVELLIAVSVGAMASVLMVTGFVYTYGSVVVEETRTSMVRQSQLFLRRMSDDVRVGNEVRATNQLTDTYKPTGWITSDPANTLIVTQPVTDDDRNFIYDEDTSYPYQNEVVYFSENGTMYRRLLADTTAIDNSRQSTCPYGTAGCVNDVELVENVENMLFTFYDVNDDVTTDPVQARSIDITINLKRQVYGNEITTSNTTRVTLRNEN